VTKVSDLIRPPVARRPEEALELVAQALSDGDLEAALAQYEKGALLAYWPQRRPRRDEPQSPRGASDHGNDDVGQALTSFMTLRLPLAVRITTVLESPELALVICERRVAGTGPDGEPVRLSGHGCAVLRPQPDGAWRIAADAWRVGTELPLDPPGIPAELAGDPVPGEGQGGQPHQLKP
jgi:ketosteroid isomerase-like protein